MSTIIVCIDILLKDLHFRDLLFLLLLIACIFACPSTLKMFFLIANRENKFREFHYQW